MAYLSTCGKTAEDPEQCRLNCDQEQRPHHTCFSKPTLENRMNFKMLLLTFEALHGLAPGYIHDLITPYQLHCALHSLNLLLLKPHVPEPNPMVTAPL